MRKIVLLAILAAACHRHAPKQHRAHAARLDDGVLRVVVIGDSLAAGTGDPDGKGIPGNLEDELRGRAATVEVKNYGVAGNTTEDVAGRLQNDEVRAGIGTADAIVLSVGANNAFQDPEARAEAIREPVAYAQRILGQVAGVVAEIRGINPDAPILLLGGYNPIHDHPLRGSIRVGPADRHRQTLRLHRRAGEAQPLRSLPSGSGGVSRLHTPHRADAQRVIEPTAPTDRATS